MKTRVVKIKSGLGNQMFQYAYARERELLHGKKFYMIYISLNLSNATEN